MRSDSILCTVRNLPLKTRASWRSLLLASDHPLSLAHLLCTWTREDVSYSVLKNVIFIYIHHTAAHVREMHVKLSPALPSKNNYANAPVSQCVQWILKNLGFPQRAGARCYQKNTNLHNPPPEHTNNQSKGDIESILSIHYTVYFLPHTFVLGAFLYCTIYSLALSCAFFSKWIPGTVGLVGPQHGNWCSGILDLHGLVATAKEAPARVAGWQDGRLDDGMAGWQETFFSRVG